MFNSTFKNQPLKKVEPNLQPLKKVDYINKFAVEL